MKTLVAALLAATATLALGVPATVRADSLEHIIGDRATIGLPADLAITAVHLPASLASTDLDAATVDIDFPVAARPGRASVKVRLGGKRARTVFVPVTIGRVADVAIAAHQLVPGELVTAADVRWERRAVDSRPGAAPVSAPIGQEVTAVISAGEVLDDGRLSAPPPVARGTEVRVEVRRGSVVVHARGKLENPVRPGALARVRLTSGGLVSGTLADAGRVVVEAL